MSAAQAREELEAYTWRLFSRRRKAPEGQLVASVLAAADKYAEAVASERAAGNPDTPGAPRARLEAAVAEIYGSTR